VNHTARPYYALNKSVESGSKLAYYEVANAQHFDLVIATRRWRLRLAPRAAAPLSHPGADIMYANLKSGTAIPASQGGAHHAAWRHTRRGAGRSPRPNVPPIAATPAAADAITFGVEHADDPELAG
jgi:hydroxybutyrate-dimer hydrolase